MIRIKREKTQNYSTICNQVLRNDQLSLKAKGLFALIIALPDDWKICQSEIQKHSTDGLDSHRTAFKELKKYGYVETKRLRNAQGQVGQMEYIVKGKTTL